MYSVTIRFSWRIDHAPVLVLGDRCKSSSSFSGCLTVRGPPLLPRLPRSLALREEPREECDERVLRSGDLVANLLDSSNKNSLTIRDAKIFSSSNLTALKRLNFICDFFLFFFFYPPPSPPIPCVFSPKI